ncbi:hypothetical protein [Stakelama tenebrarum]|uniref:Uncharacterized protein n=1 Tax=Stakelama tenebrarum TaxID=2711215 RepID=A0A6G6Y3B7_9SPHN|nr:hypothetical protein [Sphingosinithalassobacter tenebrarum]QIG79103.1 hypothetical protein G5C33_04415 [Sphingosinithalassobacter tenebrarum]
MTDDIRQLWSQDAADATGFTPAEMHARAARLRRRLIRRDAVEYVAGAVVIGAFGFCTVVIPDWGIRVSCIALIIGTLVIMRNLWKQRMPRPPEAMGASSATFYRAELIRQRDSLINVWRWYLAPLVPGTLLFLLMMWRAMAEFMPGGGAMVPIVALLAIDAAVFGAIHWLNRRAARELDAEIEAIDGATPTE